MAKKLATGLNIHEVQQGFATIRDAVETVARRAVLILSVAMAGCSGTPGPDVSESQATARSESPTHGGELTTSIRSEPRTFNRLMVRDSASSLVVKLTQAPLVRINRLTDRVEPWLAEGWTRSEDGLSYTLRLRSGIHFSDGTPLTSADVAFTFQAVYDPHLASPLADALRVDGQPLTVSTPDRHTVVVTFPSAFSPGVRLLHTLPILPAHRLRPALEAGTLAEAWGVATPPEDIVGLGPFVLASVQPGQRLTFTRNPHYWRTNEQGERLPYLDRLVLEVVPDQDAEMLRFEAGEIDFVQGSVRPEDYASYRRAAEQGRVRLHDLGVALDADFLFFNLDPSALAEDPRRAWLQADEFRRAVSHAVDREAFAETVYLGLGEPVYGPVTAANQRWYNPDVTVYAYDPAAARRRLAGLGLTDDDGDGLREGAAGHPVRFTLLTQRGHSVRERAAAVLAEDLRQVGIGADVVALEFGALIERITQGRFDAVYLGFQTSDTDPAANLDLWLSSSAFHFWHPSQLSPATEWERRIDDLMRVQVARRDEVERKAAFDEVQALFAEYVPAIYFAAPRLVVATSPRVVNARPGVVEPFILWSADTLASSQARATSTPPAPES